MAGFLCRCFVIWNYFMNFSKRYSLHHLKPKPYLFSFLQQHTSKSLFPSHQILELQKSITFIFKSLLFHTHIFNPHHPPSEGEEVAMVYYRWGYAPHHYTSEEDWRVRTLVEKLDVLFFYVEFNVNANKTWS